jgi:fatty acid synthase
VELIRLLQAIHCEDIPGHIYRGYTLLKKNVTEPIRDIEVGRNFLYRNGFFYLTTLHRLLYQYFPGENRPVWFVFAGMGSQWTTMGKSLMKLPVFAQTINKCHAILKPKGVDLLRIVTSDDPKIFDSILNSFVGIAAIQVN